MSAAVLLLLGSPSISNGQSDSSNQVPLPRVFFGAGLAPATNDGASRMRIFGEGSSLVWLLEAGAAVSERIGVGVEFAHPTAVEASTSGRSFFSSGRQNEHVLMGLVRARAFQSSYAALDLIGGAGILIQHHEEREAPCFSGCETTHVEEVEHHAPAFALGADVPLRVAPHIWVSGAFRWYALWRGEHLSELPELVPWQFEWRSSNRFALGVTARVGW